METKKALFLNKYLLTCIEAFNDVLLQEPLAEYEIDGELVNFKVSDFETHYNDFLDELEVVISETADISTTFDYIMACLNDIIYWEGFHSDQNKIIFSIGYEVNFLIKLKQNIEKYSNLIKGLCEMDKHGNQVGLYDFYDSIIDIKLFSKDEKASELVSALIDENNPIFDIRFDYGSIKEECDELKNTQEMILLIHDRINYLKQWQIEYDIYEGGSYKFSSLYYPNFEKLCNTELERLEMKIELEKKLSIPSIKTTESKPSEVEPAGNPYKWNSSNNDLIELVTAMFMVNALKREDGKKITLTELTDFFEKLFNIEIKNDKGTRAYISDSFISRTLFLQKLMDGFKKYRDSKTEKKPETVKTRNTGY